MADRRTHPDTDPQPQAPRGDGGGGTTRLHRYMTDQTFGYIVASVIGVACGAAAALLKLLIKLVGTEVANLCSLHVFNWPLLASPLAGIMLTIAICHFFFKYSPANGTAKLLKHLKSGEVDLRPSLVYSPVVTSSVTLGFGGSAGGEGPIALAGAALGSNIGRMMGLRPDMVRVMFGCGAAAGIAGIFKAPLGGALYSLEVLRMEFSNPAIMAIIVAVIIAALTAYALSGFTFDIAMDQSIPFDPTWIPWIIALGVFCGIYSLYYKYFLDVTARLLGRMKNIWVKGLAGGCVLSIAVWLCPSLYGEGYTAIGHVINGNLSDILHLSIWEGQLGIDTLILVSGLTLLLKTFACATTNYSGGVAGQFAPTLFAGCMAGLFFALMANSLFSAEVNVAHFAFFGMAGVMAGVIRAPLMAIFLTCEMSGSFGYIMAVSICVAFSMGVVRHFTAGNFFQTTTDRFNGLISWVAQKIKRNV